MTALFVGIGGFIGAILRSYVNGIINHHFKHDIPFGTLSVNLIGSFIMGILFAFFTYTNIFSNDMKALLATGMLGAFTTFSTFALETFFLIKGKNYILALSNISLNLIGTIFFAASGFEITKWFLI